MAREEAVLVAETIVSVEHKTFQAGGYNVKMTVTRIWDPEFAARMKQTMLAHLLAQAPAIVAAACRDGDDAAD